MRWKNRLRRLRSQRLLHLRWTNRLINVLPAIWFYVFLSGSCRVMRLSNVSSGNFQEQVSPVVAGPAGPVTPDWSGFQVRLLKHFFVGRSILKLWLAYIFVLFRHILRCLHMGIWHQVPKLLTLTCGEFRYTF